MAETARVEMIIRYEDGSTLTRVVEAGTDHYIVNYGMGFDAMIEYVARQTKLAHRAGERDPRV
jgi:hypothetical protein